LARHARFTIQTPGLHFAALGAMGAMGKRTRLPVEPA
jgi:hypothetical protein